MGGKLPWLKQHLDSSGVPVEVATDVLMHHVVVCGYGQVGRNLVRLVQEHGLPVVVIDQSESRIQQVRGRGALCVCGKFACAGNC